MEGNLRTAGCGLLETHITWEDIEQRIQKETKLKGSLGPKRKAQLIGGGKGFLSRVALIEADFQGESGNLPTKFIVKMVSGAPLMELGESIVDGQDGDEELKFLDALECNIRDLHNREVNVYRVFSRFDNTISMIPQIYFAQDFNQNNNLKGFIGMEYVDNTELLHIYHNIAPKQLLDILRAVAFVEAKSLQISDEEKKKLASNLIPTFYLSMLDPATIRKALINICTTSEELKHTDEEVEEMVDEFMLLELTSTLNDELGMKDVFVHGDLWPPNFLWRKTTNGLKLRRILDYQFSHFGCAATDMCVLFITTLSGKNRQDSWEWLLEQFHGYLVEYCEKELPFTIEQLKESYRRLFPVVGVLLLATGAFDQVVEIATRNMPEEEKKAVQTVILEKIVALFDDILFLSERNREIRKNVKS